MKQNLNEQIARIKQLLAINESFNVIETKTLLNEGFWDQLIKKMGTAFETKFITSIEGKLGKKIATATDAEIGTALKSAELAVLRKEIAAAVYTAEKTMIDGVFSKYNMSVASEASAAYAELQSKGLNRSILRDVASEWKGASKAGSSVAPTTPPPTAGSVPNFNIPNLNTTVLNQAWKMDAVATRAALKAQFPKASSRDIELMVQGLNKAKDQATFDIAIKDAVENFKPTYIQNLSKPGKRELIRKNWNLLPSWAKTAIGLSATVVGYRAIKAAGIPIDNWLGWLIGGAKEVGGDQYRSAEKEIKKGFKTPNSDNSSGINPVKDSTTVQPSGDNDPLGILQNKGGN
jgi:hypothetical protein